MIKRIIGLLAAAATIAIVCVTILHRDRYRSMVEPAPSAVQQLPAQPETPVPTAPAAPAIAADSTLQSAPATPAEESDIR